MAVQARAFDGNAALIKPEAAFAYSIHTIKGTDKFALAFKNRTDEKVNIEIYDAEETLVFKDVQHKDEMYKVYDLKNIGAGTYIVVIESGNFVAREELEVGAKAQITQKFQAVALPDAHNDEKMRIAFSNAQEDVQITITDKYGYTYYSTTVADATNFNQVFNLSKLTPGIYQVTMTSGGQTVQKSYAVK